MRRNTVSGLRKQRRHTTRAARAVSPNGSDCQYERLGLSVQTARTVGPNGFGLSVRTASDCWSKRLGLLVRTARTVSMNSENTMHQHLPPAVSVPERQRFCSENLNYSALFESKKIYKYNKECLHDTFFL